MTRSDTLAGQTCARVPEKYLYAGVTVFFAISIGVFASVLGKHNGFPLDDSWIHQTIGRNFSISGSLGYLPHQKSSGSTSLIWTLILALKYKLFPYVGPVTYSLVINSLCVFAIGALLLRAAITDGVHPSIAVLWAAAPAFDGNFIWLTFTGMEHLLFLTLSLISILLWVRMERTEAPAPFWCVIASGLSMGLLSMTRPEGVILVILLLSGHLLLRKASALSSSFFLTAAIACGLSAIPFLLNLVTSHSLLPLTLKGREWLYFTGQGSAFHLRIELLQEWVMRPFKMVAAADGQQLHGVSQYIAIILAFSLVIGILGLGFVSLIRQRRWAMTLICAWGILHSLLYVVILPASGHGGRYQSFFLLLTLPVLVMGILSLFQNWPSVARTVAVATLLVIGGYSISLWRRVLISGIDHINATHGVVATWINTNLPGKPIAVFDIGRIGFDRANDSESARIIDLGGLTDSGYLPYLLGHRVPEYLEEHHVQYAVFPTDENGASRFFQRLAFEGNPRVQLTPLFRACSDEANRNLSWIETRNASPCQEVDELTFLR